MGDIGIDPVESEIRSDLALNLRVCGVGRFHLHGGAGFFFCVLRGLNLSPFPMGFRSLFSQFEKKFPISKKEKKNFFFFF